MNEQFERIRFSELVDEIFAQKDREKSMALVDSHKNFWTQMRSGSQGFSGKKTINASTMFNELFEVENNDPEITEDIEDSDDAILEVLGE